MYSLFRQQNGFTVVELLVVVTLLVIVSALLFQGFVGYGQLQQHRQVTNDIKSLLQTARQQSQTRTADDAYGISTTATSAVLFAQSATTTALQTVTVPSTYTITSTLGSGLSYLTFARRTGVPSTDGTITIFDNRRLATTTITIMPSGLVE